ncbi:Cna B-type domain-containing protein, partial [Youngiibacter multivorans]
YTVGLDESEVPSGWVLSGPVMNDAGVWVFTNTNNETTSLSVLKTWVGAPAPTSGTITANVYRNGGATPVATFELTSPTWAHTFTGLDKYDDATGLPYTYTVGLDEADINAALWMLTGPVQNDAGVWVFTNTYIPQDETAWAANTMEPGTIRYTNKSWATYLQYTGGTKTVAIFTGQTTYVGTATLSPISGGVRIVIALDGYEFQEGGVVHIQGYTSTPPKKNPAIGSFTAIPASGTSFSFDYLGSYSYYGIHMMVHEATNGALGAMMIAPMEMTEVITADAMIEEPAPEVLAPLEEPPAEQPPAEQPLVEELPVEELPVEQPPVEEPPVDQPPVEEKPGNGNDKEPNPNKKG